MHFFLPVWIFNKGSVLDLAIGTYIHGSYWTAGSGSLNAQECSVLLRLPYWRLFDFWTTEDIEWEIIVYHLSTFYGP